MYRCKEFQFLIGISNIEKFYKKKFNEFVFQFLIGISNMDQAQKKKKENQSFNSL